MWEFPGGKVDPGETETEALVRECLEELGVRVDVSHRVGADVLMADGRYLLKVFLARLVEGVPYPHEHSDLRWLGVDELESVPWLPADAPIVASLKPLLA